MYKEYKQLNLSQTGKDILEYWKSRQIFEKSIQCQLIIIGKFWIQIRITVRNTQRIGSIDIWIQKLNRGALNSAIIRSFYGASSFYIS